MCIDSLGKTLKEYLNKAEAQDAVEYVKLSYGKDVVAYRCKRCNLWHLSPKERSTPSRICPPCGKDTYMQKDANSRADIIYKEKGIKIHVYKCPYNSGWHLTSKT